MSLLRFAPYREIASEVAARLATTRETCDPLAPWSEEVVVPSRGMAEAIIAALLERLPHGIAGLQIRFVDELAVTMVTAASLAGTGSTLRVATTAERRLAMRAAVRASEHPMMDSRGIASMLERSWRDVRDSAIPLDTFARRVRDSRVRNPRRIDAILRVWNDYSRLISALGAVDPADLLGAATRLASDAVKPQIVAGFYDMTGAQLELIQALLAAGRVAEVWIPIHSRGTNATFAEPFVRALSGGAIEPDSLPPRSHVGKTVTSYETRYVELRSVCARIEELLVAGTPPASIGIVARSFEPYDIALLNRFAAEYGFRTTLLPETPLTAHRIGRGAVTLLRLRDRNFPRAEVIELLRDGIRLQRGLSSRAVDAIDLATRRAHIAGGTSSDLKAIADPSREAEEYMAIVSELEELTSSIDVELLKRLGSLFRVETEPDLAVSANLDAIAATFARAEIWSRGFEASSAIDAIENETLASPPLDSNPDAPLIRAGDVMRFRGRSVSHLFIVKMQDDLFPQRRNDDPLLPDADRQRLGVREIGDGRAEEQFLFDLVSEAATEHVYYSTASGDGFGKVMRPSRYLRGIAELPAPVPSTRLESRAPRRRALQLFARAGTGSTFDGYVSNIQEQVRARLESISPTQLEDFGECPQKFFLKHILGVRDLDDPEHELQINARDKGSLDHRILERFYRDTPPDEIRDAAAFGPELPRDMAERLETIIDEEFLLHERHAPPFNRTMRGIEQRATKRILHDFVVHDLHELESEALVPRRFEYRFGRKHRELADHPEPFVVDAGGMAISVDGTIDRVDQNADGRYRIVDYKSGKASRHKNLSRKIARGVRLQLALYAMAVADFFEADPSKVSGAIKPLVTEGIKPAQYAFALHEQREALLETLGVFVTSILSGSFPAFPSDSDDLSACRYCPVNQSCRTRHDADETRALEDSGDPLALLGGRRAADESEESE